MNIGDSVNVSAIPDVGKARSMLKDINPPTCNQDYISVWLKSDEFYLTSTPKSSVIQLSFPERKADPDDFMRFSASSTAPNVFAMD